MNQAKWYLRTPDETFGPETEAKLIEWARLGKILPGQEVSDDNMQWQRVEDVPFLDMRFSIDIGDGNPRGPFNRAAAEALLASGRLPKTATLVETRAPFEVVEEETKIETTAVSDVQEVRVEVPVEKIVEKEVIKEVRVEVPVEKIVEKIVVDETRVRELEGLLKIATERNDKFETALKDATDRENKYADQIAHLEDELRRLPQAASEVADIQVAVYSIMKTEAEELGKILEQEKHEFEAVKKRYEERSDALLERRRVMLKRAGVNIEDMTRKALIERPEDPRTVQLRKELEETRRVQEKTQHEYSEQIRILTEQLRQSKAEGSRLAEGMKDIAQLQAEIQVLREKLQVCEKDLLAERQQAKELRQQQATRQQALLARLATLESPSIGTAQSMSTNQSREAKLVKLPNWMRLGK